MVTEAPTGWDAAWSRRSPIFDPIAAFALRLQSPDWPTLADLDSLAGTVRGVIRTGSGATVRFVAQRPQAPRVPGGFERRTWECGEVQVRERNWHDLFNALAWVAYPRTKAALNARHVAEIVGRPTGGGNRGSVADALTLFDESGLVVACVQPGLAALLADGEWKALFRDRRADVLTRMRFLVFGHSIFEKALAPFRGIVARAVVIPLAQSDLDTAPDVLRDCLDGELAARVADVTHMREPRELAPVPILGIPGWHRDNAEASFYDDAGQFRPRRR